MDEPQSSQDGVPKSKFTYRHLNLLSSSTPPKENPLRCVVLIDLDCFYAQVEQVRLGIPKDEPLAVQQWQYPIHALYNINNSPARKFGLGRHITATEAKKLCPNIHLAHVQTWAEGDTEPHYHENPTVQTHKVSLDPYRRASLKIIEIFRAHCDRVEKASIDESFLDLSTQLKQKLLERYPELSLPPPYNDASYPLPPAPSITFSDESGAIVPLTEEHSEEEPTDWDDVVMYLAAEMIRDTRREVEEKLGYTCSAGIAQNKMLAKLAAGWKKPNQQTVLRNRAIQGFLKDFKFTKIRNLGGKFGAEVASVFDTDQVSDLWNYSAEQLRAKLGQENGSWVYNTCRGIDFSEINPRTKIKSMLSYPAPSPNRADRSAKNFQPALNASDQAAQWLRVLTADLASRVNEDEDHRLPRTITIHHRHGGSTKSRQAPLPTVKEMGKEFLYTHALSVWRGIEAEGRAFPANNISVAVSGFGDVEDGVQGIQGFLVPGVQTSHTSKLEVKRESTVEMSGKRKRDDDGIAKFLMKKEETTPPPQEQVMQEVEDVLGKRNWEDDGIAKILMKKEESTPPLVPLKDEIEEHDEMETGDTYVCSKCHKHFPLQEMEEHEDYHVALELSKGSPIRAPSLSQAKTKAISKEEKKGPKKKIKPVEKGQRRLDFGM